MFEEQERVVDALLVTEFDQLLLERQGFRVPNSAELEEVQDHGFSLRLAARYSRIATLMLCRASLRVSPCE